MRKISRTLFLVAFALSLAPAAHADRLDLFKQKAATPGLLYSTGKMSGGFNLTFAGKRVRASKRGARYSQWLDTTNGNSLIKDRSGSAGSQVGLNVRYHTLLALGELKLLCQLGGYDDVNRPATGLVGRNRYLSNPPIGGCSDGDNRRPRYAADIVVGGTGRSG